MSNCNNNNTNPCNKKESTDNIAYVGPNLSCTGVETCDTLTQAIEKINNFICSEAMVQQVIINITNNIEIYNQFVEIVNVAVSCETIWACGLPPTTTTTTTEIVPTTTTTTTEPKCFIYELQNIGDKPQVWTAKLCSDGTNTGGIINIGQTITTPCVDQNSLVIFDGTEIKDSTEC
jgi:hypothetical protein